MKYVIFNIENVKDIAVCFPDCITHKSIVEGVFQRDRYRPVSAGFYRIESDKILPICYGESESTKLKSRPEKDAFILSKLF